MKKPRLAVAAAMVLLLGVIGPIFAQTASQFPQGLNNWVGTSGDPNNGDRDRTVVLFFEIPDSTAGTIYFGINFPGNEGTAAHYDSAGSGGTSYWYLLGGSGALSDPSSQLVTYTPYPSSQPLAGTILSSYTRTTQNQLWQYFAGVQPSQGEHIGNKYYFKVVLQVDANVGKNSFQADASSVGTNGTAPTYIAGAKSFAFNWSPFMGTNGTTGPSLDFYPFVANAATGSLSSHNWDIDNTGMQSNVLWDKSNNNLGAVAIGGASIEGISSYSIGAQTNGSWHLNLQIDNTGTIADDLAEIWFTNGTTVLRTYSTAVAAQTADHVTATYNGGTLPVNGTGTVALQVVDSSGNPQLYSAKVWVTTGGSATIAAASNTSTTLPANGALVTTDANGLATVTVADSVAEAVTVRPYSDGTGGSDVLTTPASNVSVVLAFSVAPSLSSASSSSFTTVATQNLPVVTISNNSSTLTSTANGIYIRVPTSIGLPFSAAAPTIGGTASAKVSGTSYPNSSTLKLTLSSALTGTDTITVSGLQLVVPSGWLGSGNLQLSFDGGASYPVSDSIASPAISVNTVGTYNWSGASGTDNNWTTATNWSGGVVPPANADVVIPTGMPRQPTVDTGINAVHNLTVQTGMTLTATTYGITVSGAASIAGTVTGGAADLVFLGNVSGAGTFTASSGTTWIGGSLSVASFANNGGTVVFNGGTAQSTSAYTFNNLQKTGGSTLSLSSGALTVSGTLTVGSGNTFDLASFNFGIAALSNAGIVALDGSQGTQTISAGSGTSGMIRYKGSSGGTVRILSFYNLDTNYSGQIFTLNGGTTVNGALTVTAGTLSTGANNLTVYGAATVPGTLNASGMGGANALTLRGNLNLTGGTFAKGAGTMVFDGGSTKTLTANGNNLGIVSLAATASNTVSLQDAATLDSLTLGANSSFLLNANSLSSTGGFSLAAGTLNLGSGTFNVAGNWSKTGGTFTAGTGTVVFNAAGNQTLASGGTGAGSLFYKLSKSGSGSLSFVTNPIEVDSQIAIASLCTVDLNGQSLSAASAAAVSMADDTGTFRLQGGETISNVSMDGANGTVEYYGTAGPYASLAAGPTYKHLLISGSASFTLASGPVAVNGNFSQTAGTLSTGANAINLKGNWTVAAGATFTAGAGTVTLSGTGAQTLASGGADAAHAFNNLTINKASGAATLGAAILVGGNLALTAGTLDVSAANNYAITVNGNWSNAGTFTAQTGTVTFAGSGTSAISGTTSFYNLSCASAGKTLQFAAASTQTILAGGKLTIAGTAGPGTLISLVSSSSGTQWNLVNNSAVASSVANAFIQDSNLTVNSITANTSRNNGNNSALWLFPASAVSWSTTPVSTLWGNGANWAGGYVPNPTDSVTVPAGASQWPDLGTAGGPTIVGFTVNALAQVGNSAANNLTVTGNLVFAGTMNNATSSTITMTGAGATVNASTSIGNLRLNPGAGNTVSLSANALTLSGNLLLSSGILDLAGNGLTVSGASGLGAAIQNSGAAAALTFTGAVTLSADVSVASGGGNVGFGGTLNATSAGGQSLTLVAGAGNIGFTGAVGGTARLNALSVTSAGNVSFSSTTAANSLSQGAGTGTTSISGGVTTSGVGGVSLSTTAISLAAVTIDSSAGPGPIALAAPVTLTGNANLTSGTNSTGASLSAASIDGDAAGRSLTVMAGMGSFSVGAVGASFPLGTTLITANGLSFSGGAASVKLNSATLTLRPASAVTSIGLGGAAGILQITAADLSAVAGTCSGIIVGRAAGTGAIAIDAITVASPLTVQAGGAGGTIAVNGMITASGATGVSLVSGASTTLAADIRTNGGAIDLSGAGANVIVGAASVTLATASGGSSSAAAIGLGAMPVSANAAGHSLVLDASTGFANGNGGNVSIAAFGSAAGSALQNLTIRTRGNGSGTNGSLTAPAAYSLVIPGTTTVDIGSSSVTTLTNAANNFGSVAVSSAASVTVTDLNAIILGSSSLTGTLSVSAGGVISQSGAVTAATLVLSSVGGAALTNASNSVGTFTAANSGGGAIQLTDSSAALSLGAAGVLQSGTAGAVTITCNAAAALLTNSGAVTSLGGNVALTADDMALAGGSIGAGAGAVTLTTSTAGRPIDLGSDTAGDLGLTNAELLTITSTGLLTLGDTLHTGGITVSSALSPSNATGGVAVVNQVGGIAIGASLSVTGTSAPLSLTANGGGAASGAITRTAGTLSATGNITLDAATGIGVVGTAAPIEIGAAGGNLSAANIGSGDLYLQTTGAAAVTLGGAGYSLSEANNGILRVDALGGALVIGGNLSVGGTGSIVLNANGNITRTAGTLSAPTVLLGQTSATAVGASGAPIITAATTSLAAKSSAGDIWLSNTGNVNANAQAVNGALNIVNAGTFTTNGAIASSSSTVTLSSSGTVNIGDNVTGPGGVTIGVTTLNTALNQSAGSIASTNSIINLTADNILLAGTTNSGNANAVILPYTNGTLINLGGADAAGTLGLTSAELTTISVAGPGVLEIGNASTGAVTVSAPVAASGAAILHVRSGAGMSGAGNAITVPNLALSAAGAINVSTAASVIAAVTTAGGVTIGDANAAGLAIGTVDGVVGIASGNTAISVTETAGLLTVSQAVNAGTSSASLAGVGVTNNATVTGGGGITIAAGTGTFVNSGGATLANGGGATLVSITADDMDLLGTIAAGSGPVNLTTASVLQPIYLGTGTLALGLSSLELNTIATTGTLTIGDAAHTGTISTDGGLSLSGPAGPVALLTRGGIITLDNAVTTAGNLSANTTGSAATAGNVSGTGQLIIGAAGANSLTVVTSNGISLTNPANLANAVSLTNGSAAGAIAFYNNRNMSLTASNASTGGAITVVNGTGTLSLGTVTSTGAAAYVSLSSAGAASQTGVITAPGGLLLLGAGPYTLGGANAVPLMAANVTGAGNGVSFNSAAILTVGTVSGTSGVTTNGGNLALTTNAGDLTISQPISTGAGTVTLNPAANIGLSYVTAVITTTGAAVNLQRPVILGANSVIASGAAATSFSSTVDDSTANAHSLQVSGNASFAGAVGATPIASLVVTGTTSTSGGATAITTGTTQEYDGAVTLGVDTNFTGGAGQLVWFKSTIGGGGTAHAATITNADVEFDALVGGAANLLSTLTITTGATALNANVTTTGAQSYGGPVALGLDATFTAPAGSLVWFKSMLGGGATTRSITIVTASAQFDGAVGGAANLVTSLSVGAGAATALNANVTTSGAQSYGGPVSLGADASTITGAGALTFGSTVGQSGSRTLTVQDASSTGPVTFSGAVTLAGLATGAGVYNLAINAGGTIANAVSFANTGALVIGDASSDVFTASSGMTASAGTNTFQGTVATDLAAGHNIAVSNLTVGSGGLTINAGSGNFSFTATVSVGNVQTAVVADPTDDPTDLTITAALVDGSVSGTLQLSAGATVDLGSSDFNIKTLTNPGQDVVDPVTKAITRSVGIVRLTGLQATHAVSSAGYGTSSGAFLYYGAGGTIFTTGLVDSSVAPGPYNYWDLIVAGPGSFTPEADLVVRGSIRIKAGSLSAVGAPDRQISLGGSWRNDVGSSGFSAGGDLTRGVRFLGLVNPVYVWGDNDWFLFYCDIAGLTIRFENGRTQRILGGGAFVVRGSSASHIVLDRIDPSGGNPLNPPTAAEDGLFWFFDLVPPATLGVLPGLPMEYVDVYYSNAVSYPVSVPANVVATPYALPAPGHYCYKWLSFLFAIYSYTEDSNYDGKIDRIRVTTEAAVGNDFSGFTASVSGYAVTGYFRPVPGNTFYILLKEQPYDDTGAVPDWRISANTSLKDESTNSRLVGTLSRLGGSDWMTPGDTAWPLIGYTLTLPGNDGTFVHFSEPVVQSGGASLAAADFSASSFTRVSGSAPATTEALATLGAFGTAVLAAGATTLSVTASTEDLGAPPHWEITYDNQIIGPPPPTYPDPAIGYLDDASSYGSYGSPSPNPGPITRPSFRLDRGGENIHRITDLLASIQPSSVPGSWSQLHPDSYFAWPVYAKDRVSIALTDAQIAALTPAQTAAEGIGLIRAFDGSQWLRDQDLLLQLNLAAGFANAPSVVYDSNVDASLVDSTSGLWLPPFLETDFSGLAPAPDSGVSTKAASSPPPSPPLYDYLFSASDPKVFSIAQFDFWLHLQGAPANLYAGRLSMAQDAVGLPGNWYRLCRPFSFGIHDVRLQRGGASILNNVIDPTKGETARLSYQLPTSGAVTVTVFTLDGDVVKRLVLATQAAGDYAVDWDGRNMSGHPVARGIYFIRVVAPNIDEIRKVLVVRK